MGSDLYMAEASRPHRCEHPRVGVAVFAWQDGKFILTLRQRTQGEGYWSVPGGRVELTERLKDAAARELREETGLFPASDLEPLTVTEDMWPNNHWVTHWFTTTVKGAATNSSKVGEIRWVTFDTLPVPMWQPFWDNFLATRKRDG